MRKKLILIGICALILTVIFIRDVSSKVDKKANLDITIENKEGLITRAQAAKMISLLYYSEKEIQGLERVIVYEDTEKGKWFDKYINGVYTLGIMEESEKEFRPLDYITYRESDEYIKRFLITLDSEGSSDENVRKYDEIIKRGGFEPTEKNLDNSIKEEDWIKLYLSLASEFSDNKIEKKSLYLIGMGDTDKTEAITDQGIYYSQGLDLKTYIDKFIYSIVRDNEIIYAKEGEQTEAVIKNAWIISGKDRKLETFINGIKKTFNIENPLSENIDGVVGDIEISEGTVKKVSIKPEVINGRVLVSNDKYIEIEGYGKIKLEDSYRIYKIYGDLQMEMSTGILVGYNTTDFVVSDGKICAALIKNSIKAENIRVLIKTTGFKDIFHESVKITSDSDFEVKIGKEVKKYKAGKVVTVKVDSEIIKGGRVVFYTEKEKGKIKLLSVKRNGSNPEYRGRIEIEITEEGFTVINELPLEEYLYAVIPSEMPTSYGVEALKVQAVCARSYAYNQLLANKYGVYGAHVDDSVSFQVYNNSEESRDAILAVKDTYGQVLKYDDKIITAYYFSTSYGHTASVDEVWLGSSKEEYLTGRIQNGDIDKNGNIFEAEEGIDLSEESRFSNFIKNSDDKIYDSDFAWYRWKVTIDFNDLKKSIDANLSPRYQSNPQLIQTLVKGSKGNGEKDILGNYLLDYKSIPISTVGNIKKVIISKREKSGLISEIIIEGSENTIKVKTEYNIRCLLAPLHDDIIRKDNSVVSGLGMLPSGFFLIEKKRTEGDGQSYTITGGGYGHGVGMSQNGVKSLVDQGVKYESILKHYYQGVEIGCIY